MVNDIIEELLGLDMEPKPESLWWTNTHKNEDVATLKVGGPKKDWDLPFMEVFGVLGCRFERVGKGMQGTEKTLWKGFGRRGVTGTFIARNVCPRRQNATGGQHVFCTALHDSVNWLWSAARGTKTHNWESKILRPTFRLRMRTGEDWVEHRNRSSEAIRTKWRKLNLPTMSETDAELIWKAVS